MSKENSYRSDLPVSKRSRMPYEDLLNMNQIYCNNLKKYSENCKELRKLLSKDDMNVIDDLLKENYTYITLLAKDPLNRIEFRNLCEISLKILNIIQQFEKQKDILLYEKMQRRLKEYGINGNFSSEILSFLHEIGHIYTYSRFNEIKYNLCEKEELPSA